MKGAPVPSEWLSPADSELARVVEKMTADCLGAYGAQPRLISEHAGNEENLAHGGYGRRQIQELVQNGADQLINFEPVGHKAGRVHVVLTGSELYCANEGWPISREGVEALLLSHVSPKRGSEIGRFGLGFKSVLGISSKPEFYSRNASFGFDEEWAKSLIEARFPGFESYPILRTARALDPRIEASRDPILAELMQWATAVVRIPLDREQDWLTSDLENFPAEFLLFSPHVGRLVLEDRTDGLRREITLQVEGSEISLMEDDAAQRWRTFNTTVLPSDEAKLTSGRLIHRDELPVIWAVPLDGPIPAGQFRAFFPLRDATTLSGIINAPWQINDDRTGLLEGSRLNVELIDAVIETVIAGIPEIVDPLDPARMLELIPARGREARCWGDQVLTDRFQRKEAGTRLVPDQGGALRRASEVKIPDLRIPYEAHLEWSSEVGRPPDWAHPSSFTSPTRRSRIERLLEGTGTSTRSAQEWLEALVEEDPCPRTSGTAIRAAALVLADERAWLELEDDVRMSEVVECADETFTRIHPDWVWLPDDESDHPSQLATVHPDIVQDMRSNLALQQLGIETVTPLDELKVWMEEASSGDDWVYMWDLVRGIDDLEAAANVLREGADRGRFFQVRTASGKFHPFNEVLLPGTVIHAGSTSDGDVLVDTEFHGPHINVLQAAGVVSGPVASYPQPLDPVTSNYGRGLVRQYLAELKKAGAEPDRSYIQVEAVDGPGPLSVLPRLSPESKARFTEGLFEVEVNFPVWTVSHRTQHRYPKREFESCTIQMVRQSGVLPTSLGPQATDRTVGAGLQALAGALPVCSLPNAICQRLGLPDTVEDLRPHHWEVAFLSISSSDDDARIGTVYALAAASRVPAPKSIRSRQGALHVALPPTEVACASDVEHFDALARNGSPVVLAPDSKALRSIVDAWGLLDASEVVEVAPEVIEAGPSSSLIDVFPSLKELLTDRGAADLELVPCTEIEIVSSTPEGAESNSTSFYFDQEGRRIFYLSGEGLETAVSRIDHALHLELDIDEVHSLAVQGWRKELRLKTRRIREQSSDAARLIEALGASVIRRSIPLDLLKALDDLGESVDDLRAAELLLLIKGFDALKDLKRDLDEAGLEPPSTWAGSVAARRYVRDLGFPVEYAGMPARRRDSVLTVPGPMNLPELHDYQRSMVDQIRKLLRSELVSIRGLLSLPTGAGKTRVAVQALVEALSDGDIGSPVVWLAQSDELCEQAVQSLAQVWRFKGLESNLTISRLWAENEAEEETGGVQVVVATDAKLRSKVDDDSYSWIADCSCVVIDEAHTATSPTYTEILEWLGITQRGRERTRCPLIGLSATPFPRGERERDSKASCQVRPAAARCRAWRGSLRPTSGDGDPLKSGG